MSDNITLPREVVELLRRQHEENEKLQEELAKANAVRERCNERAFRLESENERLREENRQNRLWQARAVALLWKRDADITTDRLQSAATEIDAELHNEAQKLERFAALVTAETGKEIAALREDNERLREALAKCVDAARDCALQHQIATDSIYDQAEAALRRENNHG